MSEGVHRTHCCKLHGCKYGDENCPVADGTIMQDYPCERCGMDDNIHSITELEQVIEIRSLTVQERKKAIQIGIDGIIDLQNALSVIGGKSYKRLEAMKHFLERLISEER